MMMERIVDGARRSLVQENRWTVDGHVIEATFVAIFMHNRSLIVVVVALEAPVVRRGLLVAERLGCEWLLPSLLARFILEKRVCNNK